MIVDPAVTRSAVIVAGLRTFIEIAPGGESTTSKARPNVRVAMVLPTGSKAVEMNVPMPPPLLRSSSQRTSPENARNPIANMSAIAVISRASSRERRIDSAPVREDCHRILCQAVE